MFRSAATKLAHNSTIPALGANNDLRPLQDLIIAEKQVLNSLQRLSSDLAKNAEALRIWGSGEGDDLGDILGASATLLTLWATSLSQFSAHEYPMRDHLKAIRTREENLDELKRRRRSVGGKADSAERKLSKMGAEHKNLTAQTDALNALRAEIRSMDSEIMSEEAALGDFKRSTTRVWMGLKFGALLECAEKGTIAAEYGKLIVGEIVEEQTQPGMARSLYYGRQKTEQLLNEAHRCINEVVLSTVLINPSPPRTFQQPEHQSEQPTFQTALGAQLPTNTPQSTFHIPGLTPQNEWQPPLHPPPTDDQYPQPPHLQGLGTGPFLEHPADSASLTFSHQRYPSQPTQPQPSSSPPYHPIEQPAPPRSVDDFGLTTHSYARESDPQAQGQGQSRFATVPVKHHSYGISLLPDPQHPAGQESESFAASFAHALSASAAGAGTGAGEHGSAGTGQSYEMAMEPAQRSPQPQQGYTPEKAAQAGRFSYDMEPAQRSPLLQPQQGHIPEKTAQAQAGPAGGLSLHHEARGAYDDDGGGGDDDEAGLAYDYPGEEGALVRGRVGRGKDVDPSEGAAYNVDERKDYRAVQADAPAHDVQPPEYEAVPPESHIPQPGDRSSMTMTDARFQHQHQHQHQHQRRVPPPAIDPAEEERLLNAAAAREVSREMDALTFSPPVPQHDRDHERERAHSVPRGSNNGYGGQPGVPVAEQLVPPSAPYSGAPSPNTDSPVLPYPSSYNAPPSATDTPSPYPAGPTQMDSQPAMSRQSTDGPPRLPPLATQIPSSAHSNPSTASGEYPRSLSAFPGPSGGPLQKPTSSLAASGPPGARTISAAAFKRPQRGAGSDAPPASASAFPEVPVTPLSIRKRIPSAPYPHLREGSPSRPSRSGSGSPARPPPSHALPPVPRDEEGFDFVGAYADSGAPQEAAAAAVQRERKQSGYGDGRFSTDLEGPLR